MAIAWRRGGVTAASEAVSVALATDAGVHQVDPLQILGVGDGLAAATQLALAGIAIGDTLGLELAQFLGISVLRGWVVVTARVGAGIGAALECASVVALAVARVHAGLVR